MKLITKDFQACFALISDLTPRLIWLYGPIFPLLIGNCVMYGFIVKKMLALQNKREQFQLRTGQNRTDIIEK